jgi:hypothetical protein
MRSRFTASASAAWSVNDGPGWARPKCRIPSRAPPAQAMATSAVAERQAPRVFGAPQVPQRARRKPARRDETAEPGADDGLRHPGVGLREPGRDPDGRREYFCRVLDPCGHLVEHRAVLLDDLIDGGVEELVLGLEVVVERPEADVGGVGDLLDAHLARIAGSEQFARRGHQGCPRLRPAPVQSAGVTRSCHNPSVSRFRLSPDDSLRAPGAAWPVGNPKFRAV